MTHKQTQQEAVLRYLMKRTRQGMTNGDGMRKLMINCPEKRVRELETLFGIRIAWEKIPNPYGYGKITRYRLEDPKQPEIEVFLHRNDKKKEEAKK